MATSQQETNPVKIRITLDNQDTSGGKPNQSLSLKNIKCYFKKKNKRGGGKNVNVAASLHYLQFNFL